MVILIVIFWRKKKKLYPKMAKFGLKPKKRDMRRESTFNYLQFKKRGHRTVENKMDRFRGKI